ncbi:hypothetical protein CEP10_06030 [Cylindrospermopsis raciborskii S07]|uniref:glycosyltransferase n=1 Tax=Cylindrospermopsis raciborskii TaxID=77022 RepID=UPI000C9E7BD8|nr:glycosyltransferase [Cylindrospermopsis raciborskii]PNK02973.1 hypothetical protein CEP11_14330 [Cylindrospermopsis raciborskii S10]PNK05039.1 hypothetical protein CEP12_11785 [Cylindrospermopsis raciborskii S14]PNK09246.1 hypothetical protein CEP10_06030 [Cylindrospermopsis raciborskii S07]PNK13026.1 hypothetical protein CEP09_13655 [Cylindrospermopsis raciborskii S06]PNK18204.1 hypothetical protein CEP08_09255 [Cylindrospermopsis raciborskii S05]
MKNFTFGESAPGLVIGIDATSLRRGGGVTHLIELLSAIEPIKHGISSVIVWGGSKTLASLSEKPWLKKINPPELNQGIFSRTLWQSLQLSKSARQLGCDLLFVPGGSYFGSFHPVVTMSRNLLPFDLREMERYGWSLTRLKILLLRQLQSQSFRNADGVIFLTKYAKERVTQTTGFLKGKTTIIPHGLNPRFRYSVKPQMPILEYNPENPYRILYVSIVNVYKHQWNVVEAVSRLRHSGLPLELDLVGPAYAPSLVQLRKTLDECDPRSDWCHYHGSIPYEDIHEFYNKADLGVFASSCENMPNILLEKMAAGLPIACSHRGPMPEVL